MPPEPGVIREPCHQDLIQVPVLVRVPLVVQVLVVALFPCQVREGEAGNCRRPERLNPVNGLASGTNIRPTRVRPSSPLLTGTATLRRPVFDMILHVTSLIGRGESFSTRPVVFPLYPTLTPSACLRRSKPSLASASASCLSRSRSRFSITRSRLAFRSASGLDTTERPVAIAG